MPIHADDYANREIVTTRVFDAPRELVFRAFTDPEHLARWWGPQGFTTSTQEYDLRVGGKWLLVMHGPKDANYPGEFHFVEIERSEKLVLDHVSLPKFRLTIFFEDLAGKTKVSFRQLFDTAQTYRSVKGLAMPGNEQIFDKLAVELAAMGAGTHEMRMSRIVPAPRELVWKAWTDPVHLAQWWGPRGFTNPRCELDLRVGGAIHIDMRGFDGTIYPMSGKFLEIVPPERLVFTACPLDPHGKPVFEGTNAVEFHQEGPITRIDLRATVEKVHDPVALRYLGGREQGWSESLYRLADVADQSSRPGQSATPPGNEQNFDKPAVTGGGSHEMLMSRVVLAPRELVWKAWTDPAHLAKWWGPRGFSCPNCEFDLRVGGKLRVDMQHPDGTVRPMIGQFLEINPPERLVFTAIPLDPSGKPLFEATNAVDFRQDGPMTRINVRATVEKIHDPIALRFLSGRDQGWSESLYRLADMLDEMSGSGDGVTSALSLKDGPPIDVAK
jgi:uncharacterized protein YndB with AHSA1/START domain